MYGQSTGLQAHLRPGALELWQGLELASRGIGLFAYSGRRIRSAGGWQGSDRPAAPPAGRVSGWLPAPLGGLIRPPGLPPVPLRAVDLRFSTKPSAPRARTCARIYGLQGLTDTAFSAVPYLYGLLLFGPLYGPPALYGPPLSPLMGERTTLRSILLPPLSLPLPLSSFTANGSTACARR